MILPEGFLQVDVDGLWAVRRCYGRPENDSFESDPCWIEGIERLARTFESVGTPAGFFIVGRDLELKSKRERLRGLIRSGFEIGNHSYTHTIGLTRKPSGFILDELERTDRALRGVKADPVGFRAPGYDVDARVLRCVRRLGYKYDASLLPTHLGPALRLADAWMARRWDPTKRQFGRMAYGRAPRGPYFPRRYKIRKEASTHEPKDLLEIPVGVTPGLRLPLTAATLLPMGKAEIRELLDKLAANELPVLLLLHAIDGVDCREPIVFDNRISKLGGFSMSGRRKEKRLRFIVEEFAKRFNVMKAGKFAKHAVRQRDDSHR